MTSHDRLVEILTRAGFVLTSTSNDADSARIECIFEHQLERLAFSIDDVTAELDAHALTVGAIYDGWDVELPAPPDA